MAVVHELGSPLLGFEKFSSNEVDLVSALCTGYDTAKIIFLGLDSHACIVRIQESLPLEEVFEQLNTSRGGLSSSGAAERLQLFGANRLQEKRVSSPFWIPIICILNSCYIFPMIPFPFMYVLWQENKVLKFLSFMWNPLSWVMEAAAVMALVLANGGVSSLTF